MGTLSAIFEQKQEQAPPVLALAYVPGGTPQGCSVLQCTPEGACVAAPDDLPDVFILREIDCRIERMCRVMWREGELVGVQYVNIRKLGYTRDWEAQWTAFALYPA
jgi:hypothetical protein